MSSLNRAVKNCLPTIPKEYKAYPVFTPYARLWSVKLWPSLVSDTTIKAISLRPALRAKARGHTRSNTNSALTKQPQYSSPTWLGLEETLTICTHARDTKIDCARTSSRSALNMPTGTGCYSRGLGGKIKCSWFYDERAETLGWEMRSHAFWLTHSGARAFLEVAENDVRLSSSTVTHGWRLLHALPRFISKEQVSLQTVTWR